jgi:TonB family protein
MKSYYCFLLVLLAVLSSFPGIAWASGEPPYVKSEMLAGPLAAMPRPDYPIEARERHWTGIGVYILHIDRKSGRVTSVTVQQSAGHSILDAASLAAYSHWRFKPNSVAAVRMPTAFGVAAPTTPR